MPVGQSSQSPIMVDLDSDEVKIQKDKVAFMKNMDYAINSNSSSPTGQGQNKNILTPFQGNALYTINGINLPAGKNYVCGHYESEQTSEAYVFVWNEHNNHLIYRLNADGTQQIVYKNKYLNFQLDPKHFIGKGRCNMHLSTIFNKVTGQYDQRKFLEFTDFFGDQRFIEVEDSIATNSFDYTLFPIFEPAGIPAPRYDEELSRYINLGVATPHYCIGVTPIPRRDDDKNKQNSLIFKGWQWRVKYIDVYGRESEYSIISERWFAVTGANCVATSSGLPRCVSLKLPAGNAFVDKIQVNFRNCSGNSKNLSNDTDWFKYEIFDKYGNCGTVPWYERTINNPYQVALDALGPDPTDEQIANATYGKLKYNPTDNTFDYTFCNDKLCEPLDVLETSRLFNPLPPRSSGLAALNKGLLLTNNERGQEPLSCDQLEKIDYTVTAPSGTANDFTLRKIVVYAEIRNIHNNKNGAIYGNSGYWGRSTFPSFPAGTGNVSLLNLFEQVLADVNGFLGYLAGTKYYAISQQVKIDSLGVETVIDLADYPPSDQPLDFDDYIYRQKFTIFAPPGIYLFRIANHHALPTDKYQRTSTYVYGTARQNDTAAVPDNHKELFIECCTGDVIMNQPGDRELVIYDLSLFTTRPGDPTSPFPFRSGGQNEGYLVEDNQSRIPIELAPIIRFAGTTAVTPFSDHNGFFFFHFPSADAKTEFNDCNSLISKVLSIGHIDETDFEGLVPMPMFFLNTAPKFRRIISGRIALCDNHDVGIAGVLVVIKFSAYGYTDTNGEYRIVLHGRFDEFASPGYTDRLIISQAGNCVITTCNFSSSCPPLVDVAWKDCAQSNRDVVLDDVFLNILGINKFGPQNGGRYGLGVTMWDWMERPGAVQALDRHFVDIPTMLDTHTFDFSKLGFTMNGSIRFPAWVKYISFFITDNLNWDDFISWIVDRVEYVDNTGNINLIVPTKIRLYYESLNEYNTQNNFSTNTGWQFITTENDIEKPVIGDQIEFIKNGDGTWFPKLIRSLARYDKAGKYIEVDYEDGLKDIQQSALIRLIRPKTCLTNNLYYELCPKIDVVDGVPQLLNGTFDYKDSYLQTRQIPVPVEEPDPDDPNKIIVRNIIRNTTFFFEHPSPSDFWGDHCSTRGRVNIKNPFEKKQFNTMEYALSKALVNKSSFNGLSYFSESDSASFDEHDWAAIIVALVENNTILFICQQDNFVVGFNDTGIRIADGRIVAASAANEFGAPQHKIGANYCCQMEEIATIVSSDGIVRWVDTYNNALVFHNFRTAQDMSLADENLGIVGGYKSWMKEKISMRAKAAIAGSRKVFVGGLNPYNNRYMVTLFTLPDAESVEQPVYINNSTEIVLAANETIVLDAQFGYLITFASFTPEYYACLSGHIQGPNMITFKQGVAWLHNPDIAANPNFNNFYGVQCKKVIVPVWNDIAGKVKRFLWNEVYCKEHKFIIDKVVTESGQESRILAKFWEKAEKFFTSDFKCAINTTSDANLPKATGVNALLDGDVLYGRWIKPRYISENADDSKYCELTEIIVYMIPSNPSGNS